MEHTLHEQQQMSRQDFALLGIHQIAYVKPESRGEVPGFAVHAADGTEMAFVAKDREVAFAAVRQYDMEPVSVH